VPSFRTKKKAKNTTLARSASSTDAPTLWIGNNVQICSGVKVGDGAVIGAGAPLDDDEDFED
jgi:UDP-3-O-[3-hydroxymyristoyl] glucosamine N-acyltransferase